MKLVSSFLWLVRKILPPSHRLSFWASGNKRNWCLTQCRRNREAGRELLVIIRTFHIQILYFQQLYQGHLDSMLGTESLLGPESYYLWNCFCFRSWVLQCYGPYIKINSFGLEFHVPSVILCCHSFLNALLSWVSWKTRYRASFSIHQC